MTETPIARLQRILREKAVSLDTPLTIQERRADLETKAFRVAPDIALAPLQVAGCAAEWVRAPEVQPGRAILYLHGGGYTIGSINSHRSLAGEVSRAAQAAVLLLEYRLAPEHPFPAAVQDGVAALRWLLAQGFQTGNLAVAGDSAGGGLVIATLLGGRDEGLPMPGVAACLSPWTDLTCSNASYHTRAQADPMVGLPGIKQMAALYLQGHSAYHPLASPNYADLRGLPPLLIHVGTDEVLLDDAIILDAHARAAGVASTLEIWEPMIHVWHAFHPLLPEGKQGIIRVGEFLRHHWSAA